MYGPPAAQAIPNWQVSSIEFQPYHLWYKLEYSLQKFVNFGYLVLPLLEYTLPWKVGIVLKLFATKISYILIINNLGTVTVLPWEL